jgi:hypothetical protein
LSDVGELQQSSLTIYNTNLALVHEKRAITLNEGTQILTYPDVAKSINIESINVTLPTDTKLYSQQYRYDKLTLDKLLEAHINKKISLRILKNAQDFKIISATLLSYSSQNVIVQTSDYKIKIYEKRSVIFEDIPQTLITKPSLLWNVESDKNTHSSLEVDYLIKNISWSSNYILNIDKESANLTGWISIKNNSGKVFKNTDLKLLAGDINQLQPRTPTLYKSMRSSDFSSNSVSTIAHEGYHLYTIPFPITLQNNEKTQIQYLSKKDITIQRKYKVYLSNPLYMKALKKHNVTQYIALPSLDRELAKGVVRSYSKLKNQTLFIGETQISHTPKNTPIELKIGTNFDIKVEESLLSRSDTKSKLDATIEYNVKNSSDKEKTIELLVPFNKDTHSTIQTEQSYIFTPNSKLLFKIKVAPNTTQKFKAHYTKTK